MTADVGWPTGLLRGCIVAVAVGGLVTSGAAVASIATADPTNPTLESVEPPAPPAAAAPAAAPKPAPAHTSASDQAEIRQVIQGAVNGFNAQNWDAMRGLYCSAKQATFSAADLQDAFNADAPIQFAVTAITVSGDSAFASGSLITRTGSAPLAWHMVRENGWKVCGT